LEVSDGGIAAAARPRHVIPRRRRRQIKLEAIHPFFEAGARPLHKASVYSFGVPGGRAREPNRYFLVEGTIPVEDVEVNGVVVVGALRVGAVPIKPQLKLVGVYAV